MRITILTSTRADWGLLAPLAKALRAHGEEVSVVAANMHFMPQLGDTWREIAADGFDIARRILPGATPADTAATTLRGVAEAMREIRPDCAVILGDRYEMLAAATACTLERVPVVHIAGGAVSEGAFDDSFRHAITKLSTLHLTETEAYRRRVIQLGENPEAVINTGAIGLQAITGAEPMPLGELEESLRFSLSDPTLLVTMHAATLSPLPPERQIEELIAALESRRALRVVFTHPNNDTDPAPLVARIEAFAARNPERVCTVPSLGARRYTSALHYVAAVVGNSSSGIVEAPSAGIPTLDIGIRQRGRAAADSVVHCGDTAQEIAEGLDRILDPAFRRAARQTVNPYYRPDTTGTMVRAITEFRFHEHSYKRFHDLH